MSFKSWSVTSIFLCLVFTLLGISQSFILSIINFHNLQLFFHFRWCLFSNYTEYLNMLFGLQCDFREYWYFGGYFYLTTQCLRMSKLLLADLWAWNNHNREKAEKLVLLLSGPHCATIKGTSVGKNDARNFNK